MWLLVGVGAVLDWLIAYATENLGIEFPFKFVIASLAAVWLIANEIISILENVADIGVNTPPFLKRIAAKIKTTVEEKSDVNE